jgi:hypothetical protein
MRPSRLLLSGLACALTLAAQPAAAAWNNVFQVCCNTCDTPAVTAYAPPADPCAPACPQQVCTTRYQARCYYQPVTTYRTSYYQEPVTTYRTSYYTEAVTSYRYTSYYDPSTCCYRQAACPVTSYRVRSQCCPVQSFVTRACTVPVQSQRLMTYYEPVTTCCTTTTGAPVTQLPPGATIVPPVGGAVVPGQPGIGEQRIAPQPGIGESREPGVGSPYESGTMPPASGLSYRQYPAQTPPPPRAKATPPAPPKVTVDRIAAVPSSNVQGEVVSSGKSAAGVRVLFASQDRTGVQQYVTADQKGKFEASLASGRWLVYTHDDNDKPVLRAKLQVAGDRSRTLLLNGD